jgi:CelD/BcsL family acetyltransferase involved in cellulose biosynthesis
VGAYKTESLAILRLADVPDGSSPPNLSKATQRKFSQKQKWLAEIGATAYRHITDAGEVAEVLDVFYQQKHDRLCAQNIDNPFIKPGIRAFLHAVATGELQTGHPGMDLYALTSGGKTVAVFGGCASRHRLSGSIISFNGDSAYSRCSPGELLALHIIKDAWANKLEIFDLGAGNDAYKSRFCNECEDLVSTFLPVSALGYAFASMQKLTRRGKRYVRSIRTTAERMLPKKAH